jgi:hypothetical protein
MGYQAPKDLVLGPRELKQVFDGLPPSSPQRPILEDGVVTRDEVAVAWRGLRACLESKGLTVSEPVMNPITNTDYLYTYSRTPPSAAASPLTTPSSAPSTSSPTASSSTTPSDDEVAQGCEATYWNPVAQVYSANTPQRMDAKLAAFMAGCLGQSHVQAKQPSTFDGFVRGPTGTVDEARLRKANACLDKGVAELYPDLPYFPRP